MIKLCRSIRLIINGQTAFIAALAVLSTWACRRWDLTADFPLTLVGTTVVFPIVFSIGGAYKRREAALDHYGSIKAHGRALHFATRDWIEDTDRDLQRRMVAHLGQLLDACRNLFRSERGVMAAQEKHVYEAFSQLSEFINGLRERGLPSGEASRCNQFLSKMMIAFEKVKHITQYRTPLTLRAYSKVFIVALPVLYGPYFAAQAIEYSPQLTYVMPVLLSVVLVSLDNIQEHLEDPFDQVGQDDVMINVEKYVGRLSEEIEAREPSLVATAPTADARISAAS